MNSPVEGRQAGRQAIIVKAGACSHVHLKHSRLQAAVPDQCEEGCRSAPPWGQAVGKNTGIPRSPLLPFLGSSTRVGKVLRPNLSAAKSRSTSACNEKLRGLALSTRNGMAFSSSAAHSHANGASQHHQLQNRHAQPCGKQQTMSTG